MPCRAAFYVFAMPLMLCDAATLAAYYATFRRYYFYAAARFSPPRLCYADITPLMLIDFLPLIAIRC